LCSWTPVSVVAVETLEFSLNRDVVRGERLEIMTDWIRRLIRDASGTRAGAGRDAGGEGVTELWEELVGRAHCLTAEFNAYLPQRIARINIWSESPGELVLSHDQSGLSMVFRTEGSLIKVHEIVVAKDGPPKRQEFGSVASHGRPGLRRYSVLSPTTGIEVKEDTVDQVMEALLHGFFASVAGHATSRVD
jgi:hypothetical protein